MAKWEMKWREGRHSDSGVVAWGASRTPAAEAAVRLLGKHSVGTEQQADGAEQYHVTRSLQKQCDRLGLWGKTIGDASTFHESTRATEQRTMIGTGMETRHAARPGRAAVAASPLVLAPTVADNQLIEHSCCCYTAVGGDDTGQP